MQLIKTKRFLLSTVSIGIISGVALWLFLQTATPDPVASEVVGQTEHAAYFKLNLTFPEVRDYLTQVAARDGAVSAFDVLIKNDLPRGIDSHLMGHFVGDLLYKEMGVTGLQHCTDDIGFACAHSIVINALLDFGDDFFMEVNQICKQATGNNSYSMCFHGFGHGVLAYNEYDLPQAIQDCTRVGTLEYDYHETRECIGGVIMEMRGGIHDEILWEENGKKYLDTDNPLTMCQASYMPDEYKSYCYLYITPFIFDSISTADIPPESAYKPAMSECENAALEHQETCFGGFAKEYISFILGRDIKLVADLTDDQLTALWQSCQATDNPTGQAYCASYAVYNLYRSGTHPYEVSARYCSIVSERGSRSRCFHILEQQVMETDFPHAYKAEFCSFIETNHGYACHHYNHQITS